MKSIFARFPQRLVIALSALLATLVTSAGQLRAGTLELATTSNGDYGTLDLQTGTFTRLGSPGLYGDITSLPGTPLYAARSDFNFFNPKLYLVTLDPSNGAITSTIGNLGNNIYGLKFSASGTLYGYSSTALYTVNPATAQATLIGSYGVNTGSNYGGTFAGNTFYLQANNGPGGASNLYRVSTSTGQATLIGATGYTLVPLDYDGSTLYGFSANGQIVTLDPATGTGTFFANVSSGDTIYSAVVVPEPSTWALLGAGAAAAFLLARRRQQEVY